MKRRDFLQNTAALSAVTILSPATAFGSQANSAVRMGIIGCGGRGTAVIRSMSANTNINIIAMADLFSDKLDACKKILDELNIKKGFSAVPKPNTYTGSKAYQQLLANKDVDAVLISSPAYTHAEYFEAAANAGKHIYCEKPAAPDVAGCRKVEHVGNLYNGKKSMVIGFQIRHATPYVQMVDRIQKGDIGEVLNVHLSYLATRLDPKDTKGMSWDEIRIRNQYHFHALSGGTMLDQAIHMIDVCNWAIQKVPLNAIGTGGKDATQTFGDTWKHFQVVYEYPGINVSVHAVQFGTSFGDVCAKFIGTKGTAEAHYSGGVFISGDKPWDSGIPKAGAPPLTEEQRNAGAFQSALQDADKNKEIAFIKSIQSGNYLNEARSGAESALTAILGREAAITGDRLGWDELRNSNMRLDPMLNLSQFDK
ncbi:MAG: oxidoreductase [Bacteroidetes bacterium GWE2_41_25]|nr:MAG: oxidoreductase [Bacteroidetes bacterium GWA2_40_15]OFX91644.1 MAG: oxidoreductase [Bacteroidetes bacterium GWE2_41_25]OFX92903.1 MAG: oxidoreductase [Bacteroidetes bacterium GWC2_40_22]OFY59631.1 MAG: oxidoreductase [Bacteroidetes bacterium GWF2_41_9]HAM10607.1 gfo/Idh/MocA family oxidoreductase [Bacteroidales bacterium]